MKTPFVTKDQLEAICGSSIPPPSTSTMKRGIRDHDRRGK